MNSTTLPAARARVARICRARGLHRTTPAIGRPAFLLAAAACGAVVVSVLSTGGPASAGTDRPVSVASQLSLTASTSSPSAASLQQLEDLSVSRAQRGDDAPAALNATAGDQKTLQALGQAGDAQAQVLAQQQAAAAAKAAAEAAAKAAADEAAKAAAATPTSFQAYALQKLGGDQGQMSCLQNLWGKESRWNPNAHNPSSTAYGIPQFLDSTWGSTGIAKTSDGFRQIDAGLVYIDSRYGSPCGAWSHSRAYNWY